MLGRAAVVICDAPKPLTTDSNFGRVVGKPEVSRKRGSRRLLAMPSNGTCLAVQRHMQIAGDVHQVTAERLP